MDQLVQVKGVRVPSVDTAIPGAVLAPPGSVELRFTETCQEPFAPTRALPMKVPPAAGSPRYTLMVFPVIWLLLPLACQFHVVPARTTLTFELVTVRVSTGAATVTVKGWVAT